MLMIVTKLLGGLGTFLLAFKLLTENIEKIASDKLTKLLKKTTKNRILGVIVGTIITALLQSSTATTVMVVSFVNAGVLDLFQATSIIMGANIGTTITAHIVALDSVDIGNYLATFVGVGMILNMIFEFALKNDFINSNKKVNISPIIFPGLIFKFIIKSEPVIAKSLI